MATISSHNIFKYIFMNEKFHILIRISLKFLPKGPIDYESSLVQVIAWCQTGDKPLPEAMLTQFTNAYIDGSVQERRNSIANALELHLSCTNPSICRTKGRWVNVEKTFMAIHHPDFGGKQKPQPPIVSLAAFIWCDSVCRAIISSTAYCSSW